jgi:4-hydroxyphenylpyruvate dioxygenase-like putative hemolysin
MVNVQLSGIDHIEFYAGDARQLAYFLFDVFGFDVHAGSDPGASGDRASGDGGDGPEQRRGARTFGSSNINALYEAVERARAQEPAIR